jgi:dihydrofolate synthase / folylpolyglutamate synthase
MSFTYSQCLENIHFIAAQTGRLGGEFGLERCRYLLHLLGSPQQKTKVIHIAGTSGKGSTATLISHLLVSQGFKVGLHISPHLLDIRERVQINNQLIDKDKFAKYYDQVYTAIQAVEKTYFGLPSYYETLIALAYHSFYSESVDYTVVEVGCGGLLDGSNVASGADKLCVLTPQGYDHEEIVGYDLAQIALNDAGIIHTGNQAIQYQNHHIGDEVVQNWCQIHNAELTKFDPVSQINITHLDLEKTVFDWTFGDLKLTNISLNIKGDFQAGNAGLALTAITVLAKRDNFELVGDKIRKTLGSVDFAGRCQVFRVQDKLLLLDGAHNPQKMKALITYIQRVLPNKQIHFLVAFKGRGKGVDHSSEMLDSIAKVATEITCTSFEGAIDFSYVSVPPNQIYDYLTTKGLSKIDIQPQPNKALSKILNESKADICVVTGSLYLLAMLYPELDKLS